MAPFTESRRKFEQILIGSLDKLYAVARQLTGYRQGAEDLVQETSLKALRKFHQLRDPGKAEHWLLQILINTFRDQYRHRQNRMQDIDTELTEELMGSVSVKKYNTNQIFGELQTEEILAALSKVPAEFRMVVTLVDIQNYSYRESADLLQCSMGTIASRLFRGRALLRKELEDIARQRGLLP